MSDAPAIYGALADVMESVKGLAKRDRNAQGGFNFRGIDAVVNAVGPGLRKARVVVVPDVREYQYGEILVGKNRTPMGHARVVVAYTFYAADGSSVACSAAGEAFDSGDKATAKAMSVAFRTALLQALALPTDEPDPDVQVYERASREQPTIAPGAPPAEPPGWEADDGRPLTAKTRARMFALFAEEGIADADAQRRGMAAVLGHPVESRGGITESEGQRVVQSLAARKDHRS